MTDMIATPARAEEGAVARLVYASQAAITGPVYAEMERIRASALRHNVPLGIHTALLHQSGWFLQWKEGPGDALRQLMDRVAQDARHRGLRIVHASRGPRLLDGPWSMAIVQCADGSDDMAARVLRARDAMAQGRHFAPPAVWRQLSTPLRHPGAARQADPEAFRRVMVCSAAGEDAFDLVRWLGQQARQPVVHRRYAGAHDLDVGTDLVDFECPGGGGLLRVIAMARRGLGVPLARAFLADHSHLVLLLSDDAGRDGQLVERVLEALEGREHRPLLVGVATRAAALERVARALAAQGHAWQPVLAGSVRAAQAWPALVPVVCAPAPPSRPGTARDDAAAAPPGA